MGRYNLESVIENLEAEIDTLERKRQEIVKELIEAHELLKILRGSINE